MQVQISKWGNSLALRIPRKIAAAMGVEDGSMAELSLRGDQLIVKPSGPEYRLDDLLAGITRDNLHGEITTGRSVGAEVAD